MTAPTLSGFAPTISYSENTVNATPQLLDANVTFADAEGDFDGGTLSLTGLLAEDTVSVRNEGAGAGQIGLTGGAVTFGGMAIGTLAGGVGATLTITFIANATSASIDALIQNLTYANSSDTPTLSRNLALNVIDAAGNDLFAPGTPTFAPLTGLANPFDGIDVNLRGTPSFVDLDGDGDLDMVVGNYLGTLRLFDNNDADTGFTEVTGAPTPTGGNPFNAVDVGGNSAPTFADLDGDGDVDMVVGAFDSTLRVFDNNDADTAFTELTGAANIFDGFTVTNTDSAPSLVDLDDDGDLDLVVGNAAGRLASWRNGGIGTSGTFTQLTGAANPFELFDALDGDGSKPTFVDLDGDGDLDAVVGTSAGPLRVLDNNDADTGFTELTGAANPFDGVDEGFRSAPSFVDIDDDGDLDLVLGVSNGDLNTFENTKPIGQGFMLTVTPEDDAPTLAGLAPSITFGENAVNAAPQLLDIDVTFNDPGGNFDGGALSLSGLLAEDTVSVRNEGTGAGQIGLNGANVTYGGVTIGTLAGGVGAALAVTFNAAATSASVDALIQNLTYANSSDNPTASRELLLNVIDAAGEDLGAAAGSPTTYTEQTGTDNPFGGTAFYLNNHTAPTLVDLDGDGDVDLVVGTVTGRFTAFDNNDADNGFTRLDGSFNPFAGEDIGDFSAPVFGDLDGDGDLDLITGEETGAVFVYDNNDADNGFTRLGTLDNPFAGIINGRYSAPALVDLDGDGDLDMVMGVQFGTFRVFDNNDADDGFTELTGAANPFSSFDVGSHATPTFVDVDHDGDLDMVSGSSAGTLRVFDNNDADAGFTELLGAANLFDGINVGTHSNPTFGDFDGDGDLDLVIGEDDTGLFDSGPLYTFENTTPRGQLVTVSVTAESDAPSLTGVATAVTFDENAVNLAPQLLDTDVTFLDPNGDFDGGTLTMTGVLAEDTISVNDQGTGAGQIGLSGPTVTIGGVSTGTEVTFGGTIIGTVAGGRGANLTITFNAAATTTSVDALIQNLTYGNSSDVPTATRDLLLNVRDASGETVGAAPGTPLSFSALAGAANPLNLFNVGFNSTPTTVDLDGDGDLDLIVGAGDGTLSVFDNNDADNGFTEIAGGANPFNDIDVGSYSTPTFVDLDGDGDLDLVTGETGGALRVFDNKDADFNYQELTGAANPLDGINLGDGVAANFVDMDDDGDLDLVWGNALGGLQVLAKNDVGAGYVNLIGPLNPLNDINVGEHSISTFADLDGDGDLDLIVGNSLGTINVFDNNDADTGFTELMGTANPFNGVDVGSDSAPTFIDVDGDGDLDLVTGETGGGLISFENTAPIGAPITVTVTGQLEVPIFTGFDASIGFDENTVNATPQLLDSDVAFSYPIDDFDGGALSLTGLLAEDIGSVRNEGTGAGQIGLVGTAVTFGGVTIGTLAGGAGAALTVNFNAATTSDSIDALIQNLTYANSSQTPTLNRDLVLSVTDASGNNLKSPLTPSFVELTGAANPFNSVNVGTYSAPTFVDLDGDGDLDLVVGSDTGLLVFDNNDADLGFTPLTGAQNPLDDIVVDARYTPAFADLDLDGDLDLVVGSFSNTLQTFYKNDADTGFTDAGGDDPFAFVSVTNFGAPSFVDLDGDGDLDLVVGEDQTFSGTGDGNIQVWLDGDTGSTGIIGYFERFVEQTGAANPFDGLDLGGQSAPTFVDLDGDGDLDMVLGTEDGTIRIFDNNDADAGFTALTGAANPFDGIDVGFKGTPTFADLDGDGDLDMVVGAYSGTLRVFDNTTVRGEVISVNVIAQNDPTLITGVPSDISAVEGETANLDLSAITLSDGDNANFSLTISVSPDGGTLSAASSGSVVVTNDFSDTLILTGSAADIDTYLNNAAAIQYTGQDSGAGGIPPQIDISANDDNGPVSLGNIQIDLTKVLTGDSGNNILTGTSDADILNGVDGDDTLAGGGGADTLDGGTGSDTASYATSGSYVNISLASGYTGGGADNHASGDTYTSIENLIGSDYDDLLNGDDNANYLSGGAGDDYLRGRGSADLTPGNGDTLDGGAGSDWADYADNATNINVSLATGFASGGTGSDARGDVFIDIENIRGTNGGDRITGDAGNNIFEGRGGNDSLFGGAGSDTADYASSGGFVNVSLKSGFVGGGGGSHAIGDTFDSIENLHGSAGDDLLSGDAGDNILRGRAGGDVLNGNGGSDTADYTDSAGSVNVSLLTGFANGGANNHAAGDTFTSIENFIGSDFGDRLNGSNADNVLEGLAGADILNGNGGIDTASYAASDEGVRLSLATNFTEGGHAAGDTFVSIENVIGSAFDDFLIGDDEDNHFSGGMGDDSVSGDDGTDTLDGGAGNDTALYLFSSGAVNINLSTGFADGGDATGDTLISIENLVGWSFNDTLIGDAGANLLSGGLGADFLRGGAGSDTLDGGDGADWADYADGSSNINISLATGFANGGLGNDALGDVFIDIENVRGTNLGDRITGDAEDNTFEGLLGADSLFGGTGSDTADYSSSGSFVNISLASGFTGNGVGNHAAGDTFNSIENLTGSAHNDLLSGDANNNLLQGGAGDDYLRGRGSNDTLPGTGDTLDGGSGSDWADYADNSTNINVSLASGFANGGVGTDALGDVFISIENVRGTIFGDRITGNTEDNVFEGRLGADSLFGGTGSDTADYASSAAFVNVSLATGFAGGGASNHAVGDTFDSIENLHGSAHSDLLNGDGGDNILRGRAGGDALNGNGGNDTADYTDSAGSINVSLLTGFAGGGSGSHAVGDTYGSIENLTGSTFDDILNGSNGNNVLEGLAGGDVLRGNGGIDTASYAASTAGVTLSLATDFTQGGHAAGDTFISIENVLGSVFDDFLSGDTADNHLEGGTGDDILRGRLGNDTLDGGDGSDTAEYGDAAAAVNISLNSGYTAGSHASGDTFISIENLTGSSHNDILSGEGNNNTLNGGLGNDSLRGFDGSDVFVFDASFGQDTIGDFADTSDMMDFRGNSQVNSFADLAVTNVGADALIVDAFGNSVLVQGAANDISADDFLFEL
ncbi:calcium-binding protein [uncultured Sulfitobacter sp.]|uniref:beta strand repeat-containing protein n=1 Tax=uncultured Sulfitobacter sp. TaxID=191468 RepID=UPI00260BE89A|nr:calcium-binding protein [uncultured Sulfitobacter sp.]